MVCLWQAYPDQEGSTEKQNSLRHVGIGALVESWIDLGLRSLVWDPKYVFKKFACLITIYSCLLLLVHGCW